MELQTAFMVVSGNHAQTSSLVAIIKCVKYLGIEICLNADFPQCKYIICSTLDQLQLSLVDLS